MLFDEYRDIIKYGFSPRTGGVSTGVYESMNLSNSTGDKIENIRRNYKIWLGSHGLDIKDVVSLKQTHSDNILTAGEEHRGLGPVEGRYPDTDAIITDTKGLILVTGHADCAPIYMFDLVNKAVGMVHAGWRGTCKEIATKTLLRMTEEYGSRAKDVLVYIGPCIHKDAFECGRDVIDAIDALGLGAEVYSYNREKAKYNASISDINRELLLSAGLKPENITISEDCTYTLADKYFSHRRQGTDRGGHAAFICLI